MEKKKPDLTVALESATATLKRLKRDLDSLDDELAKQIPLIESDLWDLKLGVRISTELPSVFVDEQGAIVQHRYLAFDKHEGKWRLLYEQGTDEFNDWTTTPLANCARDPRVELFQEYLPKLLLNAVRQLEDRIAARKRAIETVALVRDVLARTVKEPS